MIVLAAAFLMAMTQGQALANRGASTARLVSSRIEDRIVKRFDFNEQPLGNYESMPMHWRQAVAPGHPRYLEPAFDMNVGHSAPPSFKLALAGGSLACDYLAREISVHPDCGYLVTAWVKPQGLANARAYIRAYYLDHAFQTIAGSEVRSMDVRGETTNEPWTRVGVQLPAGFEQARWIGLSVHVEQAEPAPSGPNDLRPIRRDDVHGVAWFDDITVLRAPTVSLRLTDSGNVFQHDEPLFCDALVADLDGRGLVTRLELLDADDNPIDRHAVRIASVGGVPQRIPLGDLPPGFYRVRLTVDAASHESIVHEQTLVRLAAPPPRLARSTGGFGVSLLSASLGHAPSCGQLVSQLSPEAVKVPLWHAGMTDAHIVSGNRETDQLIRAFQSRGVRVIGVLADPARSLVDQFGHPEHTVLDVLAAPADRWRPYLAFLLARYGDGISAWQVGEDRGRIEPDSGLVQNALAQVREEVRRMVNHPVLAVPVDVRSEPGLLSSTADILSVHVAPDVGASRLLQQLESFTDRREAGLWVKVEPLSTERIEARGRLAEFARRIILARQAGADTVFVPQPWTVGGEPNILMPDENYLVLHTISAMLSGLAPVGEIWLDYGVSGRLFAEPGEERGVLVTWTDADAGAPRSIETDAIASAMQYDIHGRERGISESLQGGSIDVDAVPTFLLPVPIRRVQTLSSFSLNMPELEVGVQPRLRKLRLRNHDSVRLTGTLALSAPEGWRLAPTRPRIDLAPGESTEIDLAITLPQNQSIGDFKLVGLLFGSDDSVPVMTMRAPVRVSCPGLNVNVMTRLEGERLHIVQRITNQTGRSLDLRSMVLYPDHCVDQRLVRQLADGSTVVREYSIEDAGRLRGRPIRVTAEEPNGGLRCHRIVMVE